jgi:hypothetical protein
VHHNHARHTLQTAFHRDALIVGAVQQWLTSQLPEGGVKYQSPVWDWAQLLKLIRRFFASRRGALFNGFCRDELLLKLIDSGTGDPVRWSAARIAQVLNGIPSYDEHIPFANVLAIPELLRAFIPFAHAQTVIREKTDCGGVSGHRRDGTGLQAGGGGQGGVLGRRGRRLQESGTNGRSGMRLLLASFR